MPDCLLDIFHGSRKVSDDVLDGIICRLVQLTIPFGGRNFPGEPGQAYVGKPGIAGLPDRLDRVQADKLRFYPDRPAYDIQGPDTGIRPRRFPDRLLCQSGSCHSL